MFRRKNSKFKIPAIRKKQPPSIQIAVAESINEGDGCSFQVWWLDPANQKPQQAVSMPVEDAAEISLDVFSYIRNTWGGGDWFVRIYSPGGELKSTYPVSVTHETVYFPKNYKAALHVEREGIGGGSRKSEEKMLEYFIAEKSADREVRVEEMKIRSDESQRQYEANSARDERYITLISSNNSGGLQDELMTLLMNNFFTDKQNKFSDMRDMMELGKMFVPQVQAEDSTTQLLGMVGSLATAFLSRNTQAPPAAAASAVTDYINQVPPEQIASMLANKSPEEITAFIKHLTGTVAPTLGQGPVSLPPPGGSPDMSPAEMQAKAKDEMDNTLPEPGSEQAAADVPAQRPRSPARHLIICDQMLTQFRDDILAGKDAAGLAHDLIGIVNYAETIAEPPAVFVGLIRMTEESFEDVFAKFCQTVPELAGDPVIAEALREALIERLVAVHVSHVDAEAKSSGAALQPEIVEEIEQQIAEEIEQEIAEDQTDAGFVEGRDGADGAPEPEREDQADVGAPGGETENSAQDAAG